MNPPFSEEYEQEPETINTLNKISVNIGKVCEDEYDAYTILKEKDDLECFQIKF